MKKVVLVSCVSKKSYLTVQAQDLYQSQWFLKARRYVETFGYQWYILSAKFGLLAPEQTIESYNMTLKEMSKKERIEWAESVFKDLTKLFPDPKTTRFEILAGEIYREYLLRLLAEKAYLIDIPMQGMGIGYQLQWMDTQVINFRKKRSFNLG